MLAFRSAQPPLSPLPPSPFLFSSPIPLGITATIAYGASKNKIHTDLPFINVDGLGPAMSAIAFLFLSHIVALPMAQSLRHDLQRPREYHKVVWSAFVIMTFANLFFGR